jgi:hypothetical protein
MMTGQADPAFGAPNLVLPAQPPIALAIYGFRGARTTGRRMRSAVPSDIEGSLSEQDRQRLIEIADRCPVHRTLSLAIAFETAEA